MPSTESLCPKESKDSNADSSAFSVESREGDRTGEQDPEDDEKRKHRDEGVNLTISRTNKRPHVALVRQRSDIADDNDSDSVKNSRVSKLSDVWRPY